jgi:peptidoglycan hydrolase-like protein with peptidoglycan-binding domain
MGLQSQLFRGDPKLEAAAVSDPAHIVLGAAGPHVGKIQRALIQLDGAAIAQDSIYGPAAAAAVLAFKQQRNIINRSYQTQADNIVGKMTMAALDREMLEKERLPPEPSQNDLALQIEGPRVLAQPKGPSPARLQQFAFDAPAPLADAAPAAKNGTPQRAPAVTNIAITGTPQMPQLLFRVNVSGADPDVVGRTFFTWVVEIRFNGTRCRNGPARDINFFQQVTAKGPTFVPFFPVIRGGSLSVTVTATIDGQTITDKMTGMRLLGTNPTRADLFAALPNKTLRRMALRESGGGKQFAAAADGGVSACPLWSGDRLGGVGIFQITAPDPPTDDEVWNWRSNVAGGIRIFNEKIAQARGYPARVQNTARFRQLVAAFNASRRAKGLPALTIIVPRFTTGDFDDNLQQLELDAIRGFNGFAGNDGFGLELHEFRLAVDGGVLRVANINEQTLKGEAVWLRVPVADRPKSGDPKYVTNVLALRV